MNLEKSVDPRKTQKARKYSKRQQALYSYPKGEWLYRFLLWTITICALLKTLTPALSRWRGGQNPLYLPVLSIFRAFRVFRG